MLFAICEFIYKSCDAWIHIAWNGSSFYLKVFHPLIFLTSQNYFEVFCIQHPPLAWLDGSLLGATVWKLKY